MKAMKIIAIVATAVFCIAMAVGITLTAVGMEDGINTLEELFWQSEGQLSHQGPDQTASADGLKKIKLDVGGCRTDRTAVGPLRHRVELHVQPARGGEVPGEPVRVGGDTDRQDAGSDHSSVEFFSRFPPREGGHRPAPRLQR